MALLAIFSGLFLFYQTGVDLSTEIGRYDFFISLLVIPIIIFGTGSVLGLLAAVLPINGMTYRRKVAWTIPLSSSAILLILISSFGYIYYSQEIQGQKWEPTVEYDEVETTNAADCETVRNGNFEVDGLTISRRGDRQVQVDTETGRRVVYRVEWLSDCEYRIIPEDPGEESLKVKITEVNDEKYECYVATGKYAVKEDLRLIDSKRDSIP